MSSNTRKSRTAALACTMGAAAIVSLSACSCSITSTDKSTSPTQQELEARGFTSVTENSVPEKGDQKFYYVSYGQCRLRIDQKSAEEGGGLKLTQVSTRGEEYNLTVDEPSVASLDQIDSLSYCATKQASSAASQTPSG